MIDIPTMMLVLATGNLGFALLMAGYQHGAAPHPGLRLWVASRLVLGATQLLGWLPLADLRGIDAVGSVAGVALEVMAYALFFGIARGRRLFMPVAALALLVMLAAWRHGATYAGLMGLTCAFIALYSSMIAVVLLRSQVAERSLLQWLMGICNAAFAAAMAVGAWDALLHPLQPLGSSAWHGLAAGGAYLLMIGNGFGFLLLCKQRDDRRMVLLATTDCLTGMANRRAFFEQAELARKVTLRARGQMALVMLDLDHFKQINDRFGHAAGDDALQAFARTARATLREHDIMGRLGGEEFALALPATDLAGALQAAERLRQALAATRIDCGQMLTVSAGVVLMAPHEDVAEALARADRAMYAAKRAGRDRVLVGDAAAQRA